MVIVVFNDLTAYYRARTFEYAYTVYVHMPSD